MGELYKKLKEYSQSDYYPYHMPGHKRQLFGETLSHVGELDITEIEGFDNLHDAQGILKKLQEKAALLCGAEESFFLVNGSTSGILSAVSAAVSGGGKILMARGCHKAVYHAVFLRKLCPQYIFEEMDSNFGCGMPVTPSQVEAALKKDSAIQAVLIVSPTYEGLVADVKEIAKIVHKRGIPLIVDEAHGAHLGFHPAWAENSCRLGADLVIQSLHKTLPAPTQTAILHVNGSLINREKLKRYLQIYQTSSPSYLFMAAMEEALDIVSDRAEELFGQFIKNWNNMLNKLAECKCIRLLQKENSDIGKLVIKDESGQLSGYQLYEILLNRYHLQMEMATENYALAMFTVGDKEEAYARLTKALLEIDRECCERNEQKSTAIKSQELQMIYPKPVISLANAWEKETKEVLLAQAKGSIAGEFINLYPPGIPILVPGEKFTKEICTYLQSLVDSGLNVQGIQKQEGQIAVRVVKN